MDEIATNESQRKLVFEAYKESWMRQLMADTSMTPAFLRFCLAIGFTRTANATAKPGLASTLLPRPPVSLVARVSARNIG